MLFSTEKLTFPIQEKDEKLGVLNIDPGWIPNFQFIKDFWSTLDFIPC